MRENITGGVFYNIVIVGLKVDVVIGEGGVNTVVIEGVEELCESGILVYGNVCDVVTVLVCNLNDVITCDGNNVGELVFK